MFLACATVRLPTAGCAGASPSLACIQRTFSSQPADAGEPDDSLSPHMHFSGVRNNIAAGTDTLDFSSGSPLADKVVLLVNTASLCGFTPQLGQLQRLHEQYGARGLVVLAVPSNDFGEQEPGTDAEIIDFYRKSYGVTFPVTAKAHVIGTAAHPVYQKIEATLGEAGAPDWNFKKYLVSRGQLVGMYPPDADPLCAEITESVEGELK
jgi:glutathione peroxidase